MKRGGVNWLHVPFVGHWVIAAPCIPVMIYGMTVGMMAGGCVDHGRVNWPAVAITIVVLAITYVAQKWLIARLRRGPDRMLGGFSNHFWIALVLVAWWAGFGLGLLI